MADWLLASALLLFSWGAVRFAKGMIAYRRWRRGIERAERQR